MSQPREMNGLDSSTNRERKFTLLDIDVAQVSLAAEFLDEQRAGARFLQLPIGEVERVELSELEAAAA